MLNLTHHNDNAIDFLENVIARRRPSTNDPDYIARVRVLQPGVNPHFTNYDTLFGADNLQSLTPAGYLNQDKEDLLELYKYKSAIMQRLKSGVTTVAIQRIISTCQNCTISEVNSFDHSIPKNEFPEFSVHPKNLFPSCTRCNGHKSVIWRNNGSRLFLNLYLDQLPNTPYLFVAVTINGLDIDVTFTVNNPHNINTALYNKIKYHFDHLLLCKRFKENIDSVVTPLISAISASRRYLTMAEAVQIAMDTSNKNRTAFGFNYWKSVLEQELLANAQFLQICENAVS